MTTDHVSSAVAAERKRWTDALGAQMPADFKDWWQNALDELPAVAAWVIQNLREREAALSDAEFTRCQILGAMEMRAALELIAAPKRSDGTWNRDREACRELAAAALRRHDDSKTRNAQ